MASSGFDPDVDDFFAEMVAEEKSRAAKVNRLVRNTRQRTKERVHDAVSTSRASLTGTSDESDSTHVNSGENEDADASYCLQERNPYTLRTTIGDLLGNASSTTTRMQMRQEAMRTVKTTIRRLPKDLLKTVFVPGVYEPLIAMFQDAYFRETAISIMLDIVNTIKEDAQLCFGHLMPVLKNRWQKRDNMFVEASEEVRLLLMKLTTAIVRHCDAMIREFPSYLDDICDIVLVNAYSDFYNVKEESCMCTVELCKTIRAMEFKSVMLLKHIAPNLSHQRHSVRIAVIRAVEQLVLNGGAEQLKEIYPVWKSLAMDRVSAVRTAVLNTAQIWGTTLPDRLSFQHQILVPILLCIADPIAEIRNESHKIMLQLGEQHMKHDVRDNKEEEGMKDIEMYSIEETEDIDNSDLLPQEFSTMTRRQTLGARLLVRANLRKILPEVLEGMFEVLNINTRIITTKLLQTLIIYCESDMTQHVDKILSNFFRTFDDAETSFRDEGRFAARLMGRFVYPDAYLKYIFEHTKPLYAASPVMLTNVIRVMATIIRGARPHQLEQYFMKSEVGGISITAELSRPHLMFTEHLELKRALLEVIDALLDVAGGNIANAKLSYFLLVLNICSQPVAPRSSIASHVHMDVNPSEEIGNAGRLLMQKLAHQSALDNVSTLYKDHFKDALDSILSDVSRWDKTSPGLYAFEGLLINGSQSAVDDMDTLLPIFTRFLSDIRQHADVALRMMSTVNNVLANAGKHMQSHHMTGILKNIIIPSLVWSSGQVSALIRTQAMASLNCIVTQDMLQTDEQWCLLLDENNFKHILECLDEDSSVTRVIAVRTVGLMASLAKDRLTMEQWLSAERELQKKMDDTDTQIRIQTAKVFGNILQSLPDSFDIHEYRVLVKNLLVHLDDDIIDIRQQVYESFRHAIHKISNTDRKQIFYDEISSSLETHRDKTFCKLLLQHELLEFQGMDTTKE